jgi:hypothetical protein
MGSLGGESATTRRRMLHRVERFPRVGLALPDGDCGFNTKASTKATPPRPKDVVPSPRHSSRLCLNPIVLVPKSRPALGLP